MVILNWLAIILFFVIVGLGVEIKDKDTYDDLSIYTQAIVDWTNGAWTDFEWTNAANC